jgi:hypothetical protein
MRCVSIVIIIHNRLTNCAISSGILCLTWCHELKICGGRSKRLMTSERSPCLREVEHLRFHHSRSRFVHWELGMENKTWSRCSSVTYIIVAGTLRLQLRFQRPIPTQSRHVLRIVNKKPGVILETVTKQSQRGICNVNTSNQDGIFSYVWPLLGYHRVSTMFSSCCKPTSIVAGTNWQYNSNLRFGKCRRVYFPLRNVLVS